MKGDNSTQPEKIEFTRKNRKIIELLLEGKSNNQIALQLGISTRAVEYHLTCIYEKLGACSRTEAVIKLMRLFQK